MSIIRQGFESADLDVPVVLPTLNLDFANSQSLDSRITFSRGSIGTRVNRNGLIETIPANQPRFDFDPISGECRGLLIEESRTNIVTNNNDFNNIGPSGSRNGSSIISNSTTSPDGSNNASTLIEGTNNGTHTVQIVYTFQTGNKYCYSIFAKAYGSGNRKLLVLFGAGAFPSQQNAMFDLVNGTITNINTVNGSDAKIEKYPNGWYKCTLIGATTTSASVSGAVVYLINQNNTPSYQGDGTSGVYVWGAQLEAGSFPTSYIPTTASTVTRSVDNAEMTGTNFSSWYNQSEGTLFVVASPSTNGAYSGFIYLLGTDFNNGITYLRQSDYQPVFRIRSGQRDEYSKAINGAVGFGQIWRNAVALKSAISFKTNDFNSFVSGVPITGSRATAGTLPTFTGPLYLGGLNGSTYLNGTIRKLAFYPKALSPAELQYLTQ
jgi:hypothetical protein